MLDWLKKRYPLNTIKGWKALSWDITKISAAISGGLFHFDAHQTAVAGQACAIVIDVCTFIIILIGETSDEKKAS